MSWADPPSLICLPRRLWKPALKNSSETLPPPSPVTIERCSSPVQSAIVGSPSKHHEEELISSRAEIALLQNELAAMRAERVTCQQLTAALSHVGQDVLYVNCSLPSAPSNAPELELLQQSSCATSDSSVWRIRWSPNWSSEVSATSSKAGVRYQSNLKVSSFEVAGTLRLALQSDMSQLRVQFAEAPRIRMRIESLVTLGPQIPMPLKAVLDRAVLEACQSWVKNYLVDREKVISLNRPRRNPNTTDDDDVLYATAAAKEASRRR